MTSQEKNNKKRENQIVNGKRLINKLSRESKGNNFMVLSSQDITEKKMWIALKVFKGDWNNLYKFALPPAMDNCFPYVTPW